MMVTVADGLAEAMGGSTSHIMSPTSTVKLCPHSMSVSFTMSIDAHAVMLSAKELAGNVILSAALGKKSSPATVGERKVEVL